MTSAENADYGYDDSGWPVLVIVEPTTPASDAVFRAHLEKTKRYYERGERFGFIVDVRNSSPLPADKRRLLAEFIDQSLQTYGPLLVGTALVASSSIFHSMLKTFLWLRQFQEPPTKVFSTVDDGRAWLRGKLNPRRAASSDARQL
ncbi:MAG: hypothetical protein QM756_45600 [Polyangiaceae bacterium]